MNSILVLLVITTAGASVPCDLKQLADGARAKLAMDKDGTWRAPHACVMPLGTVYLFVPMLERSCLPPFPPTSQRLEC